MSNPIDQIDAMLALCSRATGVRWYVTKDAEIQCRDFEGGGQKMVADCWGLSNGPQNAAFIAASRTGWEATLRALRVACEALEGAEKTSRRQDGSTELQRLLEVQVLLDEALAQITKELEATQ